MCELCKKKQTNTLNGETIFNIELIELIARGKDWMVWLT